MTDGEVVYFIARDGLVKIGYSAGVDVRANAIGGTLLATIAGDRDAESRYHEMFALEAVGHEWFHPTPRLMFAIEVIAASTPVRSNPEREHDICVGLRVRQGRLAKGLTMLDVCRAIERSAGEPVSVSPSTVCRWESGTHSVALRYRYPLADVLGIPVDRLFERAA